MPAATLPRTPDAPAPASPDARTPDPAPGTEPAAAAQALPRDGDWTLLAPGLGYCEFRTDTGKDRITALRIDPAAFEFVLCAAGRTDGESRTLGEWGRQEHLWAAINASMYLPDANTSTGYMRDGDYINNGRIVQRFGAFFVAGPDTPDLPQAAILDRDQTDWEQILPHYRIVVQNYRMITAKRRIVWSPGGPDYSISAVAQDGDGNILFLHSKERIEAYTFCQHLLHLPLDIRTVMYVEGGGQAGLFVSSPKLTRESMGQSAMGFLVTGNMKVKLPNILGIRPLPKP